jgi:hypothetical protein
MIVKSILLFLLLIVQYQVVNKLFTLVDETNVEKWGSLVVNSIVLGFFTFKYLESFDLFTQIERFSLIGAVIVTVLVFWSYNYVTVFRNLFVNDSEPEVLINETPHNNTVPNTVHNNTSPTTTSTQNKPAYLKDFVGFGLGKRLKVEPKIEERPYLNSDKDFSKYYHKNRYVDKFDYRFNNLYHEPQEEIKNDTETKRHHSISVKEYKNIIDLNKYSVRTDTKHIPEKMDHLITM